MRFYTVEIDGNAKIVISTDGINGFEAAKLGFEYKDMNELIEGTTAAEINVMTAMLAKQEADFGIDLKTAKLLSPIVYPKQDILCLGVNYMAHYEESKRYDPTKYDANSKDATIYFSKRCYRASGDGEAIPSHSDMVDKLDYEVELTMIIGKDAKNISVEEAPEYIFGYTIGNDVSARNLQTKHTQWYFGKSLDGFFPMGPCIVTADELGDPQNVNIRCYVNDELRQDSNTSLMIQPLYNIVSELSQGMTLKAGTIIATGTPSGVGMGFTPPKFLNIGDVVRCEIDGIGSLTNTVE